MKEFDGLRFLTGKAGGIQTLMRLKDNKKGLSFTNLAQNLVDLGFCSRYNHATYTTSNLLKAGYVKKKHHPIDQYTGYKLYHITKDGLEALDILEKYINAKVL